MSNAFYITVIWFSITLLAFVIAKYQKIAFPKLNQIHILLFLILEILSIAIAIYFNNNDASSSLYILIAAIFFILVGWIKSHQILLLKLFKGPKMRPWLWRINLLIEGSEYSQNIYFLGDWFQIVAIALIWKSLPSLMISCVIYPASVYIFSVINTRDFNRKLTDKSELVKNEAWINFTKTVFRNIVVVLLLLFPYAVEQRDLTLFFGSFQESLNLITTLAQVEATVLALVITFLFVLVEFTNAAYSPRLVKSFVRQWSFKLMVFLASLSIVVKFSLVANAARYIKLSEIPNYSILIDFVLLLTIFSVLGYFLFIKDIINLMQPETIAEQVLTKFDLNWIDVVRRNWTEHNRVERLILSDDDPMIIFERYLATTIERGDIYSTKVALVLMRDKISRMMNKDDGAIIDEYLFNRIGNIVDLLADRHSDLSLEIFCDILNEITAPSTDVLKSSETGMLGVPPGVHLLRHIAEKAIDHELLDSGRRAINYLENRCHTAIKALPAYSELWLMNPENLENQQIDKDKFWKNDRQLEGVLYGYFYFFEGIGIKAIKNKSRELAWTVSYALSFQVLHIVESITEEPYQRHLVLNCLWRLEEIVKTACEEKFPGAVNFGILSFGVEKVDNESIAMIMSILFAKFIQLMAKAEILDDSHIRDIAVMSVYLARKHPHTTIPILNSLGIAGETFRKAKSDTRQENLNYVLTEIIGRIEQVEKAGLANAERGIKTKISLAAKAARNKTNQKVINKPRKVIAK